MRPITRYTSTRCILVRSQPKRLCRKPNLGNTILYTGLTVATNVQGQGVIIADNMQWTNSRTRNQILKRNANAWVCITFCETSDSKHQAYTPWSCGRKDSLLNCCQTNRDRWKCQNSTLDKKYLLALKWCHKQSYSFCQSHKWVNADPGTKNSRSNTMCGRIDRSQQKSDILWWVAGWCFVCPRCNRRLVNNGVKALTEWEPLSERPQPTTNVCVETN